MAKSEWPVIRVEFDASAPTRTATRRRVRLMVEDKGWSGEHRWWVYEQEQDHESR